MIQKAYAQTELGGTVIQTHFRQAGAGAPLVILHPSPMSSAFMVPVIQQLEDLAHLIAPDTPGYGQSDPLPGHGQGLEPYTDWLAAFMDAMGLGSAGIYGSATGAQIAIEFAKAHPDRARYLVLENAVHFEDTECAEIMERYFPSLESQGDGSHLATAWSMSDALFRQFPWYEYVEEDAGGKNVPAEMVHATALAYLTAGPGYDRAYRAAFANERADRLQQVPAPTDVIRWEGGLLKEFAARLDRFEWPKHIQMRHCGAAPEERFRQLRESVSQLSV